MIDNNELITIKLRGGNHIDLKTISSLLPLINGVVVETAPYGDSEARVLPFEKGSFMLILDILNNPILNNPILTNVVFSTLSAYLAIKIESGLKKGNYKATKSKDNKGMYDILFDDGTTRKNVPKEIIKLLKNKSLNGNAKVFVENYINENRGRLELIDTKSNVKEVFETSELKHIKNSTTIETIEESSSSERVWVDVKSWGYKDGLWILKPLTKLKLTSSVAQFDARLRNISAIDQFVIDDETQKASKYLEIELGIEYKEDIINGEITGTKTYYIDDIYANSKEKSQDDPDS